MRSIGGLICKMIVSGFFGDGAKVGAKVEMMWEFCGNIKDELSNTMSLKR